MYRLPSIVSIAKSLKLLRDCCIDRGSDCLQNSREKDVNFEAREGNTLMDLREINSLV